MAKPQVIRHTPPLSAGDSRALVLNVTGVTLSAHRRDVLSAHGHSAREAFKAPITLVIGHAAKK